ncbi:DUF4192 domain-containing protein [Pedococcus sp. 5OH_020]|uniref:DUF4192 domain-containing protein n=1 Tax=Pedococcus sp. 5OH_020 TaxID=2989814 RepID=UPI0022E9DC62|nr:DUF4192 domain-containing protein [Pedococcus sp. 5OH_020]
MTSISLRGPGDVVAALPFQLGYHPEDAVVVIALHDQVVGMIERLDLPAHEHAPEAADELVRPLRRERPDGVLVVAYESVAGASQPVLEALSIALVGSGIPLLNRLVVRGGRWYSVGCDCCPRDGTLVPDPADSPAVAELVGLEMSPLPARSALSSMVAVDSRRAVPVGAALRRLTGPETGVPQATAGGRAAQDHRIAVQRLSWLATWAVVLDVSDGAPPVEGIRPRDVAELVLSLGDLQLRDGLVAWLCPGTLPLDLLSDDLVDGFHTVLPTPAWGDPDLRDTALQDGSASIAGRRLVARLQALCRAVPDPSAAGVLTVLANVAWWLGDGAVARVCLDRALEHSPDYRLAELTRRLVEVGLRPRGRGRHPVSPR